MTNLKKKTIAAAISAAFAAAVTGAVANADENPFVTDSDGYELFAESHEGAEGDGDEGECGEGQCGEGDDKGDETSDEEA